LRISFILLHFKIFINCF